VAGFTGSDGVAVDEIFGTSKEVRRNIVSKFKDAQIGKV
jgi:hypothetical protein